MEDDVKQWMTEIIDSVKATKSSDFEIVFDPTLVRGMSYYTGTIFEIAIPEFGGSCGGGTGRRRRCGGLSRCCRPAIWTPWKSWYKAGGRGPGVHAGHFLTLL